MANGFLLRSVSFTASTPDALASGTVIANVAEDQVALVARRNEANQVLRIDADLGAAFPSINTVAVLNTVMTSGVNHVIERSDDAATWTTEVTLQFPAGERLNAQGFRHVIHVFNTPRTYRHWRIRFPAQSGVTHEVGRLLLGTRFQPARNFEFGASRGARDLGQTEFSRRGALLRDRGRILRTLQLSWPLTSTEEVEAGFLPLIERVGNSTFILAMTDPAASDHRTNRVYFGPLQGDPSTQWRVWDGWEHRVQILSVV